MAQAETDVRKSEKADPRFELEQGRGRHVSVIGQAPGDEPYIWIGSKADGFYGTINVRQLRKLRDAIDAALNERAGEGGS